MFFNRLPNVRNSENDADPHWSGVVSSLHFNGSNGSTTFTDVKGKTWTRNGTTTEISTTQSRFGGSSLSISPTNNVAGGLSTPTTSDWDFGLQDFTFEMWAYNTSWTNGAGNQQFLMSRYNGNGGPYLMQVLSNGQFQCLASNSTSSWIVNCSGGTFPLNQWNPLAFCRSGPNFMAYINGVRVGLVSNNISLVVDTEAIWLGSTRLNNVLQWGGYIDDFRVTKGICRYPENFQPPAKQNVDFGYTPTNDFVSYVTSTSPQGHSALGIYDGSNYFYNDATSTYSSNIQRITVNADGDLLTNAGGSTSAGPIAGRGRFVAMPNYPDIAADGTSHPIRVQGIGSTAPESLSYAIAVRPITGAVNAQICSFNTYYASSWAAFPMALWWFDTGRVSLQLSIGNDYSSDTTITTPVGAVPVGKWSYITVRYDTVSGGNGPVYLYVNNVKYTGTRTAVFPAYSGGFAIGSPWYHYQGGKSPTPVYFYGEMAEFTYWSSSPTTVTDSVADTLYTRFRSNVGPQNMPPHRDPYLANVAGLFHFDGTNGATTFVDSGPNALEMVRVGTSTISTAQSQFGGSSYLSATASCAKVTTIEPDFLFGSGDFTVEAYVYVTGGSGERVVCGVWETGGNLSWIMTVNSSQQLAFYYSTDGVTGVFTNFTTGYTVPTNTWTHVAASRIGSTLVLSIGGVVRYTNASFSGTFANILTRPFTIGGQPDSGTAAFTGYIDEVRITKGVGRYNGDFALQTTAYQDPGLRGTWYPAYTRSLLHFEGTDGSTTFTDVKGNSWTATLGPTISTTRSKFGSSSASFPLTNGGRIESTSFPALGAGDYTVEFFVWLTTNNSNRCFFDTRDFGVLSSPTRITLYWDSASSTMRFYQGGADRISGGNVTTGTWHHVCAERYNGVVKLFLNGAQVGSAYANTATIDNTAMMIGAVADLPSAWNSINGNMDEFRVLIGAARYRGNPFTPPVAPFLDS